ncbi:MAG: response regulator [Gammaproteobacteria bacterium]|nr:response regulator [Gammaproteobacteria bacterium]
MSNPQSPTRPTQARVLVIDDSKVVRVSLRKVLGEEFDIVEAEDGEAGWEALLADPRIQVVLTDAGMPRLDGYGLIARIRAHDAARIAHIPVNMVTAADDDAARQKALELGATDFITKPFDKAQLLARVRAQARMDQTSRDLAETSEALIEHATDDALTGVRSRRYLLRRGEQDLAFTRRHQQDLAVVVIGIDAFDQLKAQHPAAVTDRILTAIAASLGQAIRQEDTLARAGEARFAILAPTLGGGEADDVCNRIRQQIADTPLALGELGEPGERRISLTVSLGLSQRKIDSAERIEDYLALAETYLDRAQAAGGNRLVTAVRAPAPRQRISIDAALRILARGDTEKLGPHIDTMMEQILPLLAFCNEHQQWQIEPHLEAISQKLRR